VDSDWDRQDKARVCNDQVLQVLGDVALTLGLGLGLGFGSQLKFEGITNTRGRLESLSCVCRKVP
jgi:hypothetical protein